MNIEHVDEGLSGSIQRKNYEKGKITNMIKITEV